MKLPSPLIVVLVLLLPASASAQSVKLADLVGTWVGSRVDSAAKKGTDAAHTVTLVFRPDSTFKLSPNWGDKYQRWYRLSGDTLHLMLSDPGYKLTLTDQQLLWTGLGSNYDSYLYKRDTSKPNP